MHIVLIEPEIPQNTGNISRTCALTKSTLHLVGQLGFSLEDRFLKRAGLDYWEHVKLVRWDSFDDLMAAYPDGCFRLATTKATQSYDQIEYGPDDFLVFGCETKGLPQSILDRFPGKGLRIPMLPIGRSLNLSNSVAVILFEALRQQGFPGIQ